MQDVLGFRYGPRTFDSARSKIGVERACLRFRQRFPEYVWNDSVVQGKAYTYPQVKTLLDAVTEGGRRSTDEIDILNQRASLERLVQMVRQGQFDLDKNAFCSLHEVAGKEVALSWGAFRTGHVGIAGTKYAPAAAQDLDRIFADGMKYIRGVQRIPERALIFFLFGAFHQFFYDVNKRTSRLMMNGIFMSGGWDALVIDARRRHEYNASMLRLYDEKDADPAIAFLLSCYRTQDVRAAENS